MSITITHVLTTLGYGGAEMTALRLARRFSRDRFTQHVIALRGGGPLEEAFTKCGVPITVIGKRGRSTIPAALCNLVNTFRRVRPALSFHYLPDAKFIGSVAARIAKVPVVVHRQPGFLYAWPWYYRRLERYSARLADCHVACSNSVAEHVARHTDIRRPSIEVIYNGVPLEDYGNLPGRSEARGRFGLPEDRFCIVNVGRFNLAEKGQWLLVNALADIRRRGINAHLALVGDGPDREKLQNMVEKAGMREHVSMPGTTNKIPEILAAADVFALSSAREGFGIVVAEALAAGVPVVSTRSGGPEEILAGGKFGRLVPVNDPAAIADAIAELAENGDERKRLSALGKERARDFDMDKVTERYASLFESLVRKKGLMQ